MLRLVRKDILIQKKTFLIAIANALLMLVAFSRTDSPNQGFLMGATAIGYLFTSYAMSYDDKNNSHVILNSFPISRREVVLAKYLSMISFAAFGVVMIGSLGFAAGYLEILQVQINIEDILRIFTTLLLMYAVFFPLYFKFGYLKLNYLNILMFMLGVFGVTSFNYIANRFSDTLVIKFFRELFSNSSALYIQGMWLITAILVSGISVLLSLKIYGSKNL